MRQEIIVLWLTANLAPLVLTDRSPPPGPGTWTLPAVIHLTQTWPGCYDLLPSLLAPDAASDPLRGLIYQSGAWHQPGAGVSQNWLDFARIDTQIRLASAATQPPGYILTCVYGAGVGTMVRLQSADALGSTVPLIEDGSGDGIVGETSAQLRGARLVQANFVSHQDLPGALARSGQLAALVLETTGPPVPPPRVAAAAPNPYLGPVPWENLYAFGLAGGPRPSGHSTIDP